MRILVCVCARMCVWEMEREQTSNVPLTSCSVFLKFCLEPETFSLVYHQLLVSTCSCLSCLCVCVCVCACVCVFACCMFAELCVHVSDCVCVCILVHHLLIICLCLCVCVFVCLSPSSASNLSVSVFKTVYFYSLRNVWLCSHPEKGGCGTFL